MLRDYPGIERVARPPIRRDNDIPRSYPADGIGAGIIHNPVGKNDDTHATPRYVIQRTRARFAALRFFSTMKIPAGQRPCGDDFLMIASSSAGMTRIRLRLR
ncbi:MAG: hypothetical protein BWY63_02541 [Chloroflexi bacterium ADurb.Bin360]|nr:MAG: hypothetical protein BWY63_02541 [Chloroflexi bacterium ADurb.Bin360]